MDQMKLSTDMILNQYKIERLLSDNGNMSRIYLGHIESDLDKKVAIKIQRSEAADGAAYGKFVKEESKTLNTVRHPNIVRILPIQISNEKHAYSAKRLTPSGEPFWFFTMEYIPGKTLQDYAQDIFKPKNSFFSSREPLPLDWKMELFYQIAITVQFLHEKKIAHGDLKPENIMLRSEPDRARIPRPVLIDFGSVMHIGGSRVRPITCSIGYSSPEVILAVTHPEIPMSDFNFIPEKIDVWALGAILYEIISGEPLIKKEQRRSIVKTMSNQALEYKKLSEFVPNIPEKVDSLIYQMVQRDPARRPPLRLIIQALEKAMSTHGPLRISEMI